MDQNEAKRLAAKAALDYLPERGVIGLGTGSTARMFIEEVGALVKQGRGFLGVPTSTASRQQAEALGIPLASDDGPWSVDVCVDGADEVDEHLNLIKGGGGALTREKIVNQASKLKVIVVDSSKMSRRLGEKWAVPVEVLRFGHASTAAALRSLGEPRLRMQGKEPFVTDAGGYIYDLVCGVIENPAELERELDQIPGVVETGLFIGRTSVLLLADAGGITRLSRG
ncbi:MAG: ribose-5-phosphate isomerase RpiA [Myxococcales bacterium]|nr:ribose-5-phosphate isomerase RpiA [Polyangiaceae bacterium]MDW8250040.1 ribose-5-phosphate isomerase RpiA [Myxococcales bacterium]